MSLIKKSDLLLGLLVLSIWGSACRSVKTVDFKTPVDTTDKAIDYQKKTIYHLEQVGVYASNLFDGARLNDLKLLNDSTAIAIIKPENEPINKSAYYAFKLWSEKAKRFYIKLQYPENHEHRYPPKIEKDGNWSLLNEDNVSLEGKSAVLKLSLSNSPITVAAQEIQSSKHVKTWYTQLVKGKEDFVRLHTIGKSILGRDIPVMDIYKGDKTNKDLVILLTRQHPPEVTGYYAYQYFMETLLNDALADDFFNKYRVLSFPLVNPDGVDLGHWRHNAGGIDTNRDWSKYNQKEIKKVVSYIDKQIRKSKTKIVLGLDFHSTYHDVFYTNKIRKNTTIPNFIEDWFAALESNIDGYKVNEKSGNSTKPVSKGWFLYGHNAVGITYEIGDKTPKDDIAKIGEVSAQEMMKILINFYKPNQDD